MARAALGSVLALAVAVGLASCGGAGESPGPTSTPPTTSPTAPPTASPTRPISGPTSADLPLTVAVTVPIFGDFVRQIGGENVKVFSLLPADADPHTHKLTAEELGRIAEADFFFVNGLGLDDAITELIEENRREDAKVIPFAPNIRSPRGQELGDYELTAQEADDNPHLWLDPMLARTYAEIVADTFDIYDGVNKSFYDGNFSTYRDRISQLDLEIRAELERIPPENRKLITLHDSFEHFARRYGLEVIGFVVADPQQRPDEDNVAQLAETVRAQGVPAVFAEHGFDRDVIERVAAEAGVQVCNLYSDIVDETAPTYEEMMRSNIQEIAGCLGGTGG